MEPLSPWQLAARLRSLGLNKAADLIRGILVTAAWAWSAISSTRQSLRRLTKHLERTRSSLLFCLWCQLLPFFLFFRMCQPSWWPRLCLFPWQWGDTGSSARGRSTVSLSKQLSGSQTVTTWCQSGARWWSSALGVWLRHTWKLKHHWLCVIYRATIFNQRNMKYYRESSEHEKTTRFCQVVISISKWCSLLKCRISSQLCRLCHGTPTAASRQGQRLCREAAEILRVLSQPAPTLLRLCQVSPALLSLCVPKAIPGAVKRGNAILADTFWKVNETNKIILVSEKWEATARCWLPLRITSPPPSSTSVVH